MGEWLRTCGHAENHVTGNEPFTAKLHGSIDAIDASQWDALRPDDNPFVSHVFLSVLENTGCIRPDLGWRSRHLTISEGETLVAAAPCYLKNNSHGEFVFDHAWAHAYSQHGFDYFPKLLCASPYSPVTGPRLLAKSSEARRTLLQAILAATQQQSLSSAHVNFHLADETADFDDGWCMREDLQYIWRNRGDWTSFEEFLAAMDSKHRKNIKQERRKLLDSGVSFRWIPGHEASVSDCERMHGFYLGTFELYGNHPALTSDFFRGIVTALPTQTAMCFAMAGGEAIAAAFYMQSSTTLYGRYWGSSVELPGLHFETCYQQGIEHCLRSGLQTFEPGAGGVHKIARGFLPELTRSHHWIKSPEFQQAIHQWCDEERNGTRAHLAALIQRSPFKA